MTNEKTDTPVSVFELREVASGRIGYGDTKYHQHLLGLAADRIDELLKQLVFVEKALVELRGSAEPRAEASEEELVAAARAALKEMCDTYAPRISYTEAVNRLDAALTAVNRT